MTENNQKKLTPYERVQLARRPDRPGIRDFIHALFPGFVELHGDRLGGDDPAMIGGIAVFHGMPVTVIAAVGLLMGGKNRKIKGDASLAMLSVGALGLGYLIVNKFSKSGNISGDVCTTLFGSTSILTLSKFDVWLCIVMSVIVIAVFVLLYNRIFAVTFDETFTTATGVKASAYNLIIAVVTAVIIVLAMKLVGSLLISALVIFPALSAMRVFKSFKSVVVCSAVVSVLCSVVGILASIVWSTPVGSTIVAIDIVVFLVFTFIGFLKGNNSLGIQTKNNSRERKTNQ